MWFTLDSILLVIIPWVLCYCTCNFVLMRLYVGGPDIVQCDITSAITAHSEQWQWLLRSSFQVIDAPRWLWPVSHSSAADHCDFRDLDHLDCWYLPLLYSSIGTLYSFIGCQCWCIYFKTFCENNYLRMISVIFFILTENNRREIKNKSFHFFCLEMDKRRASFGIISPALDWTPKVGSLVFALANF